MSKIFILRHAETWRKEMMFSPPLGLQEENERILHHLDGFCFTYQGSDLKEIRRICRSK